MAKPLKSICLVSPLPEPYGTPQLGEGSNQHGHNVRLEAITAEESQLGVPCVRITPTGGGVNRKILEVPYTALVSVEPKVEKRVEKTIPVRLISTDQS